MIVSVTWTGLKSLLTGKRLPLQLDSSQTDRYTLFAVEGSVTYVAVIFLDATHIIGDSGQNAADKADFEANYQTTVNAPTVLRNEDGVPQQTTEPRLGTEVIYGTHNYSDKTTWFAESIRVVGETATDDGAGTSWALAHPFVIDMEHGKVFDEIQYKADQQAANPSDPHAYAVVVKVNGIEKTMREPFMLSGGDYEVNYVNGKIVFFVSQAGNTVTVDYSYAAGSAFIISPDPGYDLSIEKAKAVWADNYVMNDTIMFEVLGYAAVFAPQLGLPPGTKIPLETTEYSTLTQLTAEASGFMPHAIPASGGAARGTQNPRHVIEFRYGTIRRLVAAAGLELRIRLKHDLPMGGDHTSATFYCTVREA